MKDEISQWQERVKELSHKMSKKILEHEKEMKKLRELKTNAERQLRLAKEKTK